ncbi:hypothetical protein [Ectothiorhodospira haloalkaliphila]|nr:hypothetical protein [Ectothiorhodospira haloalkaliphila]
MSIFNELQTSLQEAVDIKQGKATPPLPRRPASTPSGVSSGVLAG